MTERLRGKVALITGGGGGIGAGTASAFCREGAKVVLVDHHTAPLEEEAFRLAASVPGAEVHTVAADISREDDTVHAVAEAVRQFGKLDVLVNNAGVREFGSLADVSRASWERIIATNLFGTANCTKAALPALRKAVGASIVNVSSVYAVVGRRNMGQYDATKAAIISMTRTLAWEEAEYGIRVNAVCPGAILTPYHRKRYADQGIDEAALHSKQKSVSLMGRWADVREIAYPILWLASDEASFITGTAIMVDGGVSAM